MWENIRKNIWAYSIGLFLSAIVLNFITTSYLTASAIEDMLMEKVSKFNERKMTMDSRSIRFDSVIVVLPQTLQYIFTMVEDDAKTLLVEDLKLSLEPVIIDGIKRDSALISLKQNRISFIYLYKDKHGNSLFSVLVPPEKYLSTSDSRSQN